MKKGELTIIDAVHATSESLTIYKKLALKYRYRLYIVDFTDIDIEEVYKRNKCREKYKIVPEFYTEITVVDATNGENIPGATLAIRDAKGNVINYFVTKEEPIYLYLKDGSYTLNETKAPAEYELSSEVFRIDICDGYGDSVKMYNKPLENEKIYSYSIAR